MSCEHLVCAICAGPVREGRCVSCRATRAEVHGHGASVSTPYLALFATLVLLALFVALHAH